MQAPQLAREPHWAHPSEQGSTSWEEFSK
jgi:hypothetical protein